MKKGRSVVPHGHDNMRTGFVILRGNFTGKHYDRVADHADHYLIKPTIDRLFKPSEFSTISDHKDNVHWFKPIRIRDAYSMSISWGTISKTPIGQRVCTWILKANGFPAA
jgi:hypothetical protein